MTPRQRRVCDNPYVRPVTYTAELESADAEIERLRADNRRLRAAIGEFCRQQDWAAGAWKRLPHIKTLFDIDKEA